MIDMISPSLFMLDSITKCPVIWKLDIESVLVFLHLEGGKHSTRKMAANNFTTAMLATRLGILQVNLRCTIPFPQMLSVALCILLNQLELKKKINRVAVLVTSIWPSQAISLPLKRPSFSSPLLSIAIASYEWSCKSLCFAQSSK